MHRLQALLVLWGNLRNEAFHYDTRMNDWIFRILVLMLALIGASRLGPTPDAIVVAAVLGAVSTVWVGRLDILIH